MKQRTGDYVVRKVCSNGHITLNEQMTYCYKCGSESFTLMTFEKVREASLLQRLFGVHTTSLARVDPLPR